MSEEKKAYNKPLPEFRPETKPFWDAAKEHRLVIPRSRETGEFFFYPRALSPGGDMSEDIEWVESEGRGKVWTFSIHHMGPSKAYKGEPPYVVALIEMDEGVKMMSNVIDVDPGDVSIGMEVQVCFDDVTDEVTLPKFKPAG